MSQQPKKRLVQIHNIAIERGVSFYKAKEIFDALEGEEVWLIYHACCEPPVQQSPTPIDPDSDWECPECQGEFSGPPTSSPAKWIVEPPRPPSHPKTVAVLLDADRCELLLRALHCLEELGASSKDTGVREGAKRIDSIQALQEQIEAVVNLAVVES